MKTLVALSTYVTPKNKTWLKSEAKRKGIFVWELIDLLVEAAKAKR